MAAPKCSDEEFIQLFTRYGARETAKRLDIRERNVYLRRRSLERLYPTIAAPTKPTKTYPHRVPLDIKNGVVLVGGDLHLWPGQDPVAFRAFKKFAKDLKPHSVILNGDVLDFPQISRHPPIGWETAPSPKEEIEATQDALNDLVKASGKARKMWTAGNHDLRYETRLATVASEYRGISGIHLHDFFGLWQRCWSVWINQDTPSHTVVKHRNAGGIHAARSNSLNAGVTMVTNHTHQAAVVPVPDYRGVRWGVECGCLADTDHKAFVDYTEDGPTRWISAFAVLTYKDGDLLWPELVTKYDDKRVLWRGELVKV